MRENLRLGRKVYERMAELDSDFAVTGPSIAQLADDNI